jgi:hypothetical protein
MFFTVSCFTVPNEKETAVLWTLIVVLLVLWLLGMLTSVGGGFVHLLLAIAFVVLLVRLISGRRPV